MTNPFGKKHVPDAVRTEINLRSGRAGVFWNSKRFPWIHITSLCSGCAGSYVELSSIKNQPLYQPNYARPLPVVSAIDVKKQGELGTTRKATVKLTAFTDDQLRDLQKCYFIPGMGCRVEWGWSEDASGKKAPSPIGNRHLTDAQAICRIRELSSTNTHYDGIQGIVANFGYELTQENFWDCTLEIIAAAEAFGGSKVNDYSCNCAREYETEDGGESKTVVENRSQLYTCMKDLFENFIPAAAKYLPTLAKVAAVDNKTVNIAQYNYYGVQRSERGGDASSWYEGSWFGVTINAADATEAYLSWSALEAAINKFAIPTHNGEFTLGRISSKKMLLMGHEKLESTDPRICVIPGTRFSDKIATLKYGTQESAIQGDRVVLDNIMVNVVFLMNELRSVEDNHGTLREFVTNVLRKINDACGSLWDFEIISTTESCSDPTKHPVISIIDTKIYEAAPVFSIPAQAIGDRASVLRNISFRMKMTEQMKTQALYSNGKPQVAKTESGGGCGSNGFRAFGMAAAGTFRNLAVPRAADPPDCVCEDKELNAKEPTFNELFESLTEEVTDSTVAAAKAALIKAYSDDVLSSPLAEARAFFSERYGESNLQLGINDPSVRQFITDKYGADALKVAESEVAKSPNKDDYCVGMPMPFEFSFTLDGIGGFSFGQMVTCDRIPYEIRTAFDWQVTSVEHSISNNDWTTTVNTVCRYKK